MNDREQIYKLLNDVLLELREAGAASGDAKVFKLANLVHQLPNDLAELDAGKLDAADVLENLRERARWLRIEAWLDQRLHNRVPNLSGDG